MRQRLHRVRGRPVVGSAVLLAAAVRRRSSCASWAVQLACTLIVIRRRHEALDG